MSEHIPINTHLELDPRLLIEAASTVGMLMHHRGTRPWTFEDDAVNRGNLDGMEELPGITDKLVVGRLAGIAGKSHGVSYDLEFLMYDEIAGTQSHSRVPMIDMRVYATVGDMLWSKDEAEKSLQDPRYGALRGLIWIYSNRTTTVDFGHGTRASSDPEPQRFLERLVRYYGIDAEDLFAQDARQSFVYDNDRLKKLTAGLHELMASEL